MALQFDGNGVVNFPSISFTGDFSITGTFTYIDAVQVFLGNATATSDFLACFNGGSLRGRIGGSDTGRIDGLVAGQAYTFTYSRSGNLVTLSVSGFTDSTGINTNTFTLGSSGSYNNGSLDYGGLLSGNWVFTGASSVVQRTYNFEQPVGSMTLPDETNSQNGTLSGFTTGGFTEPAGAGITITSPSAFTARQRDSSGNATFTITGTCDDSVTAVEVSTNNSTWSTLDSSPTTTYSGTVVVNGQQTVYVRAANNVTDTANVANITSAACIVAWGQSNVAGRGVNNQSYTIPPNGITPIMYRSGSFSQMQDPTGVDGSQAGSLWPLIAQRYINDGIPVCIANVGEGGTAISQWSTVGTLYNRIVTFASSTGGLEESISIIGETDSASTTREDFKTRYLNTTTGLNTSYNVDTHAVRFPVGDNTPSNTRAQIRQAYDELIAENAFIVDGGDLSTIDIDTGVGEDGLHLRTDSHFSEASAIIISRLFNEISSLTISVGAPDGTYRTVLVNDSNNVVYSDNATYSGGSTTLTGLTVAPATNLEGYVVDNENPHENGAVIVGTTE